MTDAASLAWLALKGTAIAAVPLAYVALSRDPAKFRRLAWVTAFLTLDLIMFGSFTRLTDSGLGCPDWPGCYGHSNPLSAGEPIRAAETAMPTGPVTMTKAWIEMLHRYFAMAVGLLIIILAALAWSRARTAVPAASRALAGTALIWVCVQGAFGALTVTMKLQPVIVTMHLLGGMTLLALLTWLAVRASPVMPAVPAPTRVRALAAASLVALGVQIALGGWVSSNYAVLACTDFPRCQDAWWPPMDFERGFALWRDLGRTTAGEMIPFQALVAIHWAHRLFALIVLALLAILSALIWRRPNLAREGRWLMGVLLVQLATGLSNVVLEWPLVAAVVHSGGAALMVALLVLINVRAAGGASSR